MTTSDHIARRLRIFGRVQGVWFRDTCRREATANGVTGFARNCRDGSVEVHLEGTPLAVERLIEWCRHGPERAHVERVDIEESDLVDSGTFSTG